MQMSKTTPDQQKSSGEHRSNIAESHSEETNEEQVPGGGAHANGKTAAATIDFHRSVHLSLGEVA